MDVSKVTSKIVFRDHRVPDIGLKPDLTYPLRVYVLLCRCYCYYVGISTAEEVAERLCKQFSGDGSHYCKVNTPLSVLCVYPAACHSIEAAMYFAMQKQLFRRGKPAFEKLGGWVQTSHKPSELSIMQNEQSRRQLLGRCFTCGGLHSASSSRCDGVDNNTVTYRCGSCSAQIALDSRGGRGASASAVKRKASDIPAAAPLATAKKEPAPKRQKKGPTWDANQSSLRCKAATIDDIEYIRLIDLLESIKAAGKSVCAKSPGQKCERYRKTLKLKEGTDYRQTKVHSCRGPAPYLVTWSAAEKIFAHEVPP